MVFANAFHILDRSGDSGEAQPDKLILCRASIRSNRSSKGGCAPWSVDWRKSCYCQSGYVVSLRFLENNRCSANHLQGFPSIAADSSGVLVSANGR
jgi:hypothetical protein